MARARDLLYEIERSVLKFAKVRSIFWKIEMSQPLIQRQLEKDVTIYNFPFEQAEIWKFV
jgi:hypothetical protein